MNTNMKQILNTHLDLKTKLIIKKQKQKTIQAKIWKGYGAQFSM